LLRSRPLRPFARDAVLVAIESLVVSHRGVVERGASRERRHRVARGRPVSRAQFPDSVRELRVDLRAVLPRPRDCHGSPSCRASRCAEDNDVDDDERTLHHELSIGAAHAELKINPAVPTTRGRRRRSAAHLRGRAAERRGASQPVGLETRMGRGRGPAHSLETGPRRADRTATPTLAPLPERRRPERTRLTRVSTAASAGPSGRGSSPEALVPLSDTHCIGSRCALRITQTGYAAAASFDCMNRTGTGH
jgi:hypothetical protein